MYNVSNNKTFDITLGEYMMGIWTSANMLETVAHLTYIRVKPIHVLHYA